MDQPLKDIIQAYDARAPLKEARTIPAAWYTDRRLAELERRRVFSRNWQMVGRLEQVERPGQYIAREVAGEPVAVVRGDDGMLRAFFNVCRHHAAAVLTAPCGITDKLRCPYHGWTYALQGDLTGAPDFGGVRNFDRSALGLVPLDVDTWEKWVFVRIERTGLPLAGTLGAALSEGLKQLRLERFHWLERRTYRVQCDWKVFVDNYLDGGYHVPHVHKGLDSVLDYSRYTIENGDRHCLQWSPMSNRRAEPGTGAVRTGDRALYYWIYPNFMINWYEGAMDTNLIVPRKAGCADVIMDYYFPDVSDGARDHNLASIAVGEAIQEEDAAICASVQRGLASRSFDTGRLSVRREAGEHLFHRLLAADLKTT
jgi:choline monooxygenase